jgi:protein-tyrosine phosphatase
MDPMNRILFVCMGNICRSPAAEIVFRKMVEDAGQSDRFEIDSAGTIGFHKGSPPDQRMSQHLTKRGYPVEGHSRQLVASDLRDFDILLTMDDENLSDTLGLDTSGEFHHKVKPFVDFLRDHEAAIIPDPYYGGDSGFAHVIDLLEDGCASLLDRLTNSNG